MQSTVNIDNLDLEEGVKNQLKALFDSLQNQVSSQAAQIESQAALIHFKETKIQALTHELANYKRIKFGVKAEALTQVQRDLFEETLDTDIAALDAELEALRESVTEESATVARPKRVRAGRQPLPDHLPRIEHRHEPAICEYGQCGSPLVKIGEDVTEQLDVEPAKFFVHRHIRPKYACRHCETIVAEPIPPAIIDGGLAATGLLTWIMISKFQDHQPLYRLEQIAARQQVPLPRSNQAEWVGRTGMALQPLADRLKWHLLQGNTLLADETPVSQLEPGNGKTHKSYLWAYRSNDRQAVPRIIVFDYQTGRNGSYAREFLGNWNGHLMVDDYGGYKALFVAEGTKPACIELACLAHARRKFFELHVASKSPLALEALHRIAELYAIEAEAKDWSIEQRQVIRQEQSLPKLQALKEWLQEKLQIAAPNSATAKAIHYLLKRWEAFERYAHTGYLPIDNNSTENSIRPIAVGKKNWLFVGSERAGKRAAAIQTLLGTANLNSLNPADWLKDTLEKLPVWPNSRIDELLPLDPKAIKALGQK